MSETETIEKARLAVKEILSVLSVTRVVCVDDKYMDTPSVEEVIAAALSLKSEIVNSIVPELGSTVADKDLLKQQIRELWNRLDDPQRIVLAEKILVVARLTEKSEKNDDPDDVSILGDVIPKEMLLTLSPKKWELRRDDLLRENSINRTLFLFDQDLSGNGGDAQGGIRIIESLLTDKNNENLICGLLTHLVTPENQQEKWMELSRTYNIPCDRFLVVPKQYLSKDPVLFAQILKLVALSPDFASLKEKTKKILEEATAGAATQVDKISIYDLDQIVFRVSDAEGLWEPDMLFRLHALFHRLESRRLAHKGKELEGIAQRLRSVSHIPTQVASYYASSAWNLQHEELYESAVYLNQNHLPLELGDIFIKTGTDSSKFYILLAQPCDLMVRTNGKRQPENRHLPLTEIVCDEVCPSYSAEIPYFGNDPKKHWFVKFKHAHQVRACVLDMCVYSDGGEAVLPINSDPPDGIRPSLRARYTILQDTFKPVVKNIDILSPNKDDSEETKKTKEIIKKPFLGAILYEGLFKGKIIEHDGYRSIGYNCLRIGRLTRARAYALLLVYTSCLSRPAADREFDNL